MKILVTGGSGFIGSCFIRELIDREPDVEVTNLDALTYAASKFRLKNIENNPRYHFIQGNICNRNIVEKLFTEKPFDAVLNFAAESHVDRSIEDPKPFVWTNYVGVQVLLDVAKQYKLKNFIQVSTDEVYGPLGENGAHAEDDPLLPTNPYAATKAAADLLCLSYFRTYQLPVVITRSVNNYGPYQNAEKLIPLLMRKALRAERLPLYGNGLNRRSWIHIQDHCEALIRILKNPKPGMIYNIAGQDERSNVEVAKKILKQLGKSESLISFVADRPGHDFRYQLKSERLREEFQWQPKINFEEGLSQTITWYQNHPDWEKNEV